MDLKTLRELPILTKCLLLTNVVMFVLSFLFPALKQDLALHYFESSLFKPYQVITHFFMHAGIFHIMFNMYALVIFGGVLEKHLGRKRFSLLYFFSAVGAFMLHMSIISLELSNLSPDVLSAIQTQGAEILANGQNYTNENLGALNLKFHGSILGASGAIMGLLLGFAMMFPNVGLQLIFLPLPLKAKYFMPIYMGLELALGVGDFEWDNIGHFAHLGGAMVGGIFMFFWIKKGVVKSYKEAR